MATYGKRRNQWHRGHGRKHACTVRGYFAYEADRRNDEEDPVRLRPAKQPKWHIHFKHDGREIQSHKNRLPHRNERPRFVYACMDMGPFMVQKIIPFLIETDEKIYRLSRRRDCRSQRELERQLSTGGHNLLTYEKEEDQELLSFFHQDILSEDEMAS